MTDVNNTTGSSGVILKTDALGRVKLPPEKREALLAEYERSGMSVRGFAPSGFAPLSSPGVPAGHR